MTNYDEWANKIEASWTPNQKLRYKMSLDITLKIIRARNLNGLTPSELAKLAGIAPETINRIENGERLPTLMTLAKLCRALKIPLEVDYPLE
jgi:DNA-binding XRE family transcriptional regulator